MTAELKQRIPADWCRDPLLCAKAVARSDGESVRSPTAKDNDFRQRLIDLVKIRLGRSSGEDLLADARHVLAACAMIVRMRL